jgi:hypothetical protein
MDTTIDLSFTDDVCGDLCANWVRLGAEPDHPLRMYLLMFLENVPVEAVLAPQVTETPA